MREKRPRGWKCLEVKDGTLQGGWTMMNRVWILVAGLPLLLGVGSAQANGLYGGARSMDAGALARATAMAAVNDTLGVLGAALGSSDAFGAALEMVGDGTGVTGGDATDGSGGAVTGGIPRGIPTTRNNSDSVQVSSGSVTTVNNRSVTQVRDGN